MNRIDALFGRLRSAGKRALMPFITAGDPDLETTTAVIEALVKNGAHMIEVGFPYSDPIADGPVISASYTRALQRGVKLGGVFASVKAARAKVGETPLVAMVSYAIINKQGVETFLQQSVASGFDGLIVPDLPVEEAEEIGRLTATAGLKLIQLITPTTPPERAVKIAGATTGFIYYVSVAGLTGERKALPPELADNLAWLRSQTELPICVGFGLSSPEQIQELAPLADGLIVGSAIVRRFAEEKPREQLVAEIGKLVAELAAPLK